MRVKKRLGGYPCCHRQYKDDGHCRWLHGYDRWVEITWAGERDDKGWVVNFAGLKEIKDALEHQFDHTTLVASDDPCLAIFKELQLMDAISLRVMDPTMEGMAKWVAELCITWTEKNAPKARVIEVACWENEKNAAIWKA